MSDTPIEDLSDDEIMGMENAPDLSADADSEPAFVEATKTTLEDVLDLPQAEDSEDEANEPLGSNEDDDGEDGEAEQSPAPQEEQAGTGEESLSSADHTTPHQPAAATEPSETPPEEAQQSAAGPVDYEAAYKQVMAPFKANGRDYTPQSPEEVIRLMQMGANYTKKMQALTPNLKLMRMLENNGLLDESKLSFLIDLDKKNPAAIQKLLHEGQIDPLDIETDKAPAYTPGNHSVSDQEMQFHSALEDVVSTPTGSETISLINSQWDQASKEAIYREPEVLQIINAQRANGIYDQISAEVERRKMLGQLSASMPFIEAYRTVGDHLHQQGLLARPTQAVQPAPANPGPAPRRVVETRTNPPASSADPNGDRARAAAPAKASPSSPKREFDPFAMSDEEIMAIATPKF